MTAGDAREALACLAADPTIDLLISDVVMPGGMNGYELAEQATRDRPELKVLLASGYIDKSVVNLARPYSRHSAEQAMHIGGAETAGTGKTGEQTESGMPSIPGLKEQRAEKTKESVKNAPSLVHPDFTAPNNKHEKDWATNRRCRPM